MLVKHGIPASLVREVFENLPLFGVQAVKALCEHGINSGKGRILWKFLQVRADSRSVEFKLKFNKIAHLIGQEPRKVDPEAELGPREIKAHHGTTQPALQILRKQAQEALRVMELMPSERRILRDFLSQPDVNLRVKSGKDIARQVREALGLLPKPGNHQTAAPVPTGSISSFIRNHPNLSTDEVVRLGISHGLKFSRNTVYYARGQNGVVSRKVH